VLRTYLVYNTVVRLCQFFGCGGKKNHNENTFLQKNLIRVSRKMKSVVCLSVDLSILVRNLLTDLDFLKLPFMLLFCVPDLQ
jgi:hypothetical protein